MSSLFLQGNSRDVLRNLPADWFHCAMTSPPYFGLRRYDGGEEIWGGDEGCPHEWGEDLPVRHNGQVEQTKWKNVEGAGHGQTQKTGNFCQLCSAWKGQLGAEPTPELYIQHLIEIMREVRRVLRPDGVCFVNIGDSWGGSGKGQMGDGSHAAKMGEKQHTNTGAVQGGLIKGYSGNGIKPLDMVLIPEQLALTARADGWYLRSIIIWAKGVSLSDEYNGNPMPECLDPSTRVFVRTQDGWMHRVSLDDLFQMDPLPQILSPTGWVNIRSVWKTEKPAMTLRVGKVERIICSPDHRFPVSHDRRRVSTELKDASTIRFVGYNDYLLYKTIQEFCVAKIKTQGRFSLNYDIGYLVGIYLAEGSTDTRFGNGIQISLGDHEVELHDRVAGMFNQYGIDVHDDGHVKRKNVFRVYDESFCRLVDMLVTGQAKTKRLSVDLILNSPESFRQGLLEGYLAGDGSERPAGGWCAASASRRLRDDVSTLASSLGVITSKGQQRSVSEIAPNLSVGHTLWTPYIKRGEKNGTDGVFCIPVRGRDGTKQKGETKLMVDIEVEGGLFLIGDGLVSHNSVNGWRWERHKVKVADNGCSREAWRVGANDTPRQDHDKDGNFKNSAVWQDCLGCPKCEKHDGYILRKGSWRPTDSYEHILMLTKTSSYFCDREAVLERGVYPAGESRSGGNGHKSLDAGSRTIEGLHNKDWNGNGGRNLRSVLMIPTVGYKGAHFAVFPPRLVEPLVKSATSEKGCCPKCGSPWARVIDKGFTAHDGETTTAYSGGTNANRLALLRQAARQRGGEYGYDSKYTEKATGLPQQGFQRDNSVEAERVVSREEAKLLFPDDERKQQDYVNHIHDHGGLDKGRTIGWLPTCECGIHETEPCRILDPFSGAGTTALVCERLGLDSIGIDMSAEYIKLAEARIAEDEQKRIDEQIKQLKREAKQEAKLSSKNRCLGR